MASENSFDIVSKIDMQELNNAIQQAEREITGRYDFRNSKSEIRLEKEELILISDNEFMLNSLKDVLHSKMIRRGVAIKNLEYDKVEPAAGNTVRQRVELKQGIDPDTAKQINKMIKDSKLKVKSQNQADQIRVSGKKRDDLQEVISMVKAADLPLDLQFVNFR